MASNNIGNNNSDNNTNTTYFMYELIKMIDLINKTKSKTIFLTLKYINESMLNEKIFK